MKNVATLLPQVVGPFETHCASCGLLSTAAYITAPLIGIGVAQLTCSHAGSDLLDQTIAFDRAEAEMANITQTNLITVSSFNGPQGLLLGYDLLRQPLCPHPQIGQPQVYDVALLFAATRSLFGSIAEPHFPIRPGQHLLCACKKLALPGPCRLYGALAIGIAEDRGSQADLFMEDLGTLEMTGTAEETAEQEYLILRHLIDAVGQIGDNLSIRYSQVFVGIRTREIGSQEMGCVLTAAPYIHLARQAVPQEAPSLLATWTLAEWEAATCSSFLLAS